MSGIKFFGTAKSRALRSLWALEEVGVSYEQIPLRTREDFKSTEFIAINPNGKIPALADGSTILCESMAINLYLAKKYGGDLYPSEPNTEASVWQWSVWAISEIEPLQMAILLNRRFLPKEKRDEAIAIQSEKQMARPLKVLDAALGTSGWLVGSNFSIADLNVASVMLLLEMAKYDYQQFGRLSRWADACYARPALARAQTR